MPHPAFAQLLLPRLRYQSLSFLRTLGLFLLLLTLDVPMATTSFATHSCPSCGAAAVATRRPLSSPPPPPTTTTSSSNTFETNRPPAPSFYQRPLPSTCTAFSSPRGRRFFRSALHTGGLRAFFRLVDQHTTQTEPAYCGLATLVVALNAMAVDPRRNWKNPWRWYHEELLQCCCDFDLEHVQQRGITMADFRCLAICQGLQVQMYHADDDGVTVDRLRQAIRQVCVEEAHPDDDDDEANATREEEEEESSQSAAAETLSQVLVVSYDRRVLGQTGSGHFSPIAAYDCQSDTVLILDTARFKYGSHWVRVPQLFAAMQPHDQDTGKSRGFAVLQKDMDRPSFTDTGKPEQLVNRLTNPVAVEAQQEFRNFWQQPRSSDWDNFRAFWTRNDTDPGFVWYLFEPVVKPCQEDDIQAVDEALRVLRAAMQQEMGRSMELPNAGGGTGTPMICRQNLSRSIPLLHTEVIYLIYKATREQTSDEPSTFSNDCQLLTSSISAIRSALFPTELEDASD